MDSILPTLVQQMLTPAFYDHPVREPIKLIQTHISYVFLTGDYAYKVKKPISFGFLDFSTLETRAKFCQEELRLNRRLSPSLYLEVISIGMADGLYCLRREPAVEYVVRMRQFPQENLFGELFKRDRLTSRDFVDLAKQVATFHKTLDTTPTVQSYGDIEVVQSIHQNNLQISENFIGQTQPQDQYEATRAYTLDFIRDHKDWIAARRPKVKECHGDLHLGNVCRFENRIQVFDCIEFNQEFRNIDTLYDAAFMVMDLEFQGRSDLAYVFLNTYLEESGDFLGVRLLPLYLSMRAYIRGNVSSLALKDSAIAADLRQEMKQKAIAYYKLAWTYTQKRTGSLYLMSGLSGSGKSTVARCLYQMQPAIHIRSDAVRKHLAGIPLNENGAESGIYIPGMTKRTYQQLLDMGLALAKEGWCVILDARYHRWGDRQQVISACLQQQLYLRILHCTANIEVIRERLHQRQGDISDATPEILDQQLAQSEPFQPEESRYVSTIDTSKDLTPQLSTLLSKTGDSDIH